MGADYSFEEKNIEIWAPTFFKHNNSFVATVCVPSLKKASFQLVARKASQKRRHFFLVSFVKMIVFLLVLFSFQQQTPLS